jgi:hypothetical protein
MEREFLKKACEYTKYISHNDIIELVENINVNYLDSVNIKKLLSDCLNIQIEKLPIQNNTLKKEVFNTFCLMVKNTETHIITYGMISINGHAIKKKTIPKINTIAAIFVNEWISEYTTPTPAPTSQETLQLSENILQALQERGYIEDAAAMPLRWIKTNGTTHGKNPNKRALFDLLCLLGYPDDVIADLPLLNRHFVFSNCMPLKANNKTGITDNNGKLKRPIISEYHTELKIIVQENKKE